MTEFNWDECAVQFNRGDLLTCEDVSTSVGCTVEQARYQLNKLVKSGFASVSRQTVIDERDWMPVTKQINFYWKKSFGEKQFFPTIL